MIPYDSASCMPQSQVLVYHDLLGMMQHPHHAKVTPKFCKQYATVGQVWPLPPCQVRLRWHQDVSWSDRRPDSVRHCWCRLMLHMATDNDMPQSWPAS